MMDFNLEIEQKKIFTKKKGSIIKVANINYEGMISVSEQF